MEYIIVLIGFVTCMFLFFMLVSYSVYISMTRERCKHSIFSSYKKTVKEFNNINFKKMRNDYDSEISLVCIETDSKYHASILQLNGIGHILSPISYFRFIMYVRSLDLSKYEKYEDWIYKRLDIKE